MSEKADEIRGLRRDFAAPGSRHDTVVRWLRIILPVCIGALGALLALAPLTMTGDVSFVLAKEEVAVAKERMRVREALYRGEDSKGQPFSLKAGSAVQHSSKVPIVELEDLQARILLKDGPAVLRANEGQYDMDKEDVIVSGPIQFEAAGGYRLSTQDVTVDLDGKTLKVMRRFMAAPTLARSRQIGLRPILLIAPLYLKAARVCESNKMELRLVRVIRFHKLQYIFGKRVCDRESMDHG